MDSIFVVSERSVLTIPSRDTLEKLSHVKGRRVVIVDGTLEGVQDILEEMNQSMDVRVIVI